MIGKIAETICKYSSAYTVGEYSQRKHPVIHTMNHRTNLRIPKVNTSIKCEICGQLRHDTTSEGRCIVFSKWMMCKQESKCILELEIKSNTIKYLKRLDDDIKMIVKIVVLRDK